MIRFYSSFWMHNIQVNPILQWMETTGRPLAGRNNKQDMDTQMDENVLIMNLYDFFEITIHSHSIPCYLENIGHNIPWHLGEGWGVQDG